MFEVCGRSTFTRKLLFQMRIHKQWKHRIKEKEILEWEKRPEKKQKYFYQVLTNKMAEYEKLIQECQEEIKKFSDEKRVCSEEKINEMVADMIFCYRAYGTTPNEYMLFDFQKKTQESRKSFITDMNRYEYYFQMNDPYLEEILFDKYKTWKVYKNFMGREMIKVKTETTREEIQKFIKMHSEFVCKPSDLSRGEGVVLCRLEENMEELTKMISGYDNCVLEEVIHQAKEMAVLHAGSVNTVRCPTIYTKDGGVVFHPVLRMGRGGSFVDNAAAGGIIANVDAKTGLVITDGVDESGKSYEFHPDTGVKLKGFRVPRWEELLIFADRIARVMPQVRYVGWDLALTEQGWVMIEGNCHGQFLCEYVDQVGRKEELDILKNNI